MIGSQLGPDFPIMFMGITSDISVMPGHLPKNKQKILTLAVLFVTCQGLYWENMALSHTCLVYLQSLVITVVIICNTVSLSVVSDHCCQFQFLQFSFVAFSCIQLYSCTSLYLFPVNMTCLDQLSYSRACYNFTFTLKLDNNVCMYLYSQKQYQYLFHLVPSARYKLKKTLQNKMAAQHPGGKKHVK